LAKTNLQTFAAQSDSVALSSPQGLKNSDAVNLADAGVSIPFLSKIQGDTSVWLGAAYEHVPGSGPFERFRVIRNRPANQTSHTGMTDPSPA
jgi:hypothetical protein